MVIFNNDNRFVWGMAVSIGLRSKKFMLTILKI